MRKFFGNKQTKGHKGSPREGVLDDSAISTPIYHQHAVAPLPTPQPEERPAPLGSPNMPSPPSPYQGSQASLNASIKQPRDRERDTQTPRKSPMPNQPIVSNILRALEPPTVEALPHPNRSVSEDGYSTAEMPLREPHHHHQEKLKKSFWNWERNREDRDRDKHNRDRGGTLNRREDEGAAELTKVIGYLTATASEDWALVLDVCDRASANENNAKEAVRALRREFKYGEPAGQLSAARLWAIMLRNCTDVFVAQSINRKFLETVEELLMNPKTSPVVRERLQDVIAAAAYSSSHGSKKDSTRSDRDGFRGLWRRVKPIDKPDEGMPFAMDDAMFNPPVASRRNSQYGVAPVLTSEPVLTTAETVPRASPPPPANPPRPRKRRKSPTRNRIIPHDEDVRRLLQECKIGQGNAVVLSQALFHSRPESFKEDPVVWEFYNKCKSSQELVYAQIPWATAEAEKSILAREAKGVTEDVQETTREQQLLDAILAANGDLLEVLNQYDDMDRVAMERKAEYRSMKESRIDRREQQEALEQREQRRNRNSLQHPPVLASRSPSPSPSLRSSSPHHSLESRRLHPDPNLNPLLAPPPPVPHGPRSPGQFSHRSRTPPLHTTQADSREINGLYHHTTAPTIGDTSYDNVDAPVQPSAKALGKQKALDTESVDTYPQYPRDSEYSDTTSNKRNSHTFDGSDYDDDHEPPWHRPTHYVYDAAAERSAQRKREEYEQQALLVNGVH